MAGSALLVEGKAFHDLFLGLVQVGSSFPSGGALLHTAYFFLSPSGDTSASGCWLFAGWCVR